MNQMPNNPSMVAWIVVFGCCLGILSSGDVYAQAQYTDAEMLMVVWETTPEAIKGLLPPPLEPYKKPLVTAFIADFPKTNFGVTYTMAGIFIVCEYNGEVGTYCVGMPEDDDIPVFLGRESQGYPKKMATLSLKREGDRIDGWVERREIRIFELHATVNKQRNFGEQKEALREIFPDETKMDGVAFNIWALRPPGDRQFTPKLLKQVTQFRPYLVEWCDTQVVTRESPYDSPWGKLKVVRVLGSMYTRGNNTMLPAKVIAQVDPKTYAPFARMKYDW